MPTVGHNSGDPQLKSIVQRILRLTDEKKRAGEDIKDVYTEAKSKGYDVKALRVLLKSLTEDDDKRSKREAAEQEAELMRTALGDFAELPLGGAAVEATRKAA